MLFNNLNIDNYLENIAIYMPKVQIREKKLTERKKERKKTYRKKKMGKNRM